MNMDKIGYIANQRIVFFHYNHDGSDRMFS